MRAAAPARAARSPLERRAPPPRRCPCLAHAPTLPTARSSLRAQCYYIAPIKRELSQPIKNGLPSEKICERLKKSSAEICSLRFASTTLPPTESITDFSKLRVKDLKQIMAEKKLSCPDCLEKDDFVRFLTEAKGKGEL